MTLPSGSTTTKFDSKKKYTVGGKAIKVSNGSIQSFKYNNTQYTAQFNSKTGAFTRYLGTDGTELSYSKNTLPSVESSNEGAYLAAGAILSSPVSNVHPYVKAGAFAIAGTVAIYGYFSSSDLLKDISITSPTLPMTGWAIDAPFAIPMDYVSDDGVTTKPNDGGYITVFRGVHPDHPDFPNALRGIATPYGGHDNAARHNLGNNKSIYTSWSKSPFIANHFATKEGTVSGGVVLIKRVHVSEITPSPDVFFQNEVLLRGIVTGATPVPAIK